MSVVITGTSRGIGAAVARKFLDQGYTVVGIDKDLSTIDNTNYSHFQYEITGTEKDFSFLPCVEDCEILVNNAGVQNSGKDLDVNLKGLMNCTQIYGLQSNIKSIVNIGSASAHHSAEFAEYVASKGGVLAYSRWTAKEIAKYGATCNCLSPGGVLTDLNKCVMEDTNLWNEIMELTPLKRWATAEEIAEWVFFLAVINRSCTGQAILIDNGEFYNHRFVWES